MVEIAIPTMGFDFGRNGSTLTQPRKLPYFDSFLFWFLLNKKDQKPKKRKTILNTK
jgi:hypothetical protein